MNGLGLPLHSPAPLADSLLPRPPLLKRLARRLRISAHTASPPPRLLLVVLLAAQILVLAVIRLGPFAVPPSPSAGRSLPLFVGTGSQFPLKFLPAENNDSPSLPVQKTRPSLPKEGNAASLRVSVSDDELTLKDASSGDEDESSSETHTRGDSRSTFYDEKSLSDRPELNVSGDAFPTRDGKFLEERVDVLLPSVAAANSDGSQTTDEKSIDEVARLKSGDNLLPAVEDAFVSHEFATNKDVFPTSTGETARAVKGDDLLLPSVEDSFLSDAHTANKRATATADDRSAVVDVAASAKDKRSAIVDEVTAGKSTFLEALPSVNEEKSTVIEEVAAKKSTVQDASSIVEERLIFEKVSSADPMEEEKSANVEEGTAEESTIHDVSQGVGEKSDSKTLSSVDTVAGKPQNEPVVSNEGSKEQPFIAEKVNPMVSSECQFGYIYIYDLPAVFNHDIVANCSALNPWLDVCATLANGGLGESLGDASPLGQTGSWFTSDQFTAEIVFHNRMLQHPCLTDKPELASGFYVPFYAGLDVGRYLWQGSAAERRDRVSKQLLEWLDGQEYWKRSKGWNHFMMIGRITWDFRRSKDEDWGSGFFYIPPMLNTTRLLIERNPWDEQEMAVPYPTNFHPQSDADLRAWQDHLRSLKRSYLFSFAGARRSEFPNDFRATLLSQCEQAQGCKSLDCSNQTCGNSQKSLGLFLNSTFCLQPRGDSFTRRSTFDCLLAGSIPVFFWHRSAYFQYKWHLPRDEEVSSYSVFIPKEDMRNGTNIEQVLISLSQEKVHAMQETVIKMIPRIVYAVSGFSLKEEKDAFDVAIEGVLKKFKQRSSN